MLDYPPRHSDKVNDSKDVKCLSLYVSLSGSESRNWFDVVAVSLSYWCLSLVRLCLFVKPLLRLFLCGLDYSNTAIVSFLFFFLLQYLMVCSAHFLVSLPHVFLLFLTFLSSRASIFFFIVFFVLLLTLFSLSFSISVSNNIPLFPSSINKLTFGNTFAIRKKITFEPDRKIQKMQVGNIAWQVLSSRHTYTYEDNICNQPRIWDENNPHDRGNDGVNIQ